MSVTGPSAHALNDMSSMRETGMHDIPRPDSDYSFWDFLDIINPLQHIPGVSTLYRELTGDEISAPAKVIGGGIYGGFIGAALAAVDSVIEGTTGKDTGEHIIALFSDDEEAPEDPATKLATMTTDATDPATPSAPSGSTDSGPAASAQTLVNATPAKPETADQDLLWFPIQRGQDLRSFPATPRGRGGMVAADPAAMASAVPTGSAQPSASAAAQEIPLSLLSEKAWRAAPTPEKEAIQRALAAQGIGPTDHPMFNGNFAAQPTAAQQPRQAPSGSAPVAVPSWFDKAMMKALDSYERTGRLENPKPSGHGA